MEKSCPIKISPISASLDTFVTRIPVASEIIKDGICETRPSPIVKIIYLFNASVVVKPCNIIPVIIPPAKLTTVIIKPVMASPFTYFVAPSIAPKKVDSA